MRTKMTIVGIVSACALAAMAVAVGLVWALGWVGLGVAVVGTLALLMLYVRAIRPWHSRWGATDDEVRRGMPGDGIIHGAAATTRAVTIDRRPEEIWPWLAQLGYGRAGWYSYDWIDNDGRPSATEVIPDLQDLKVGDRIEMIPGMGPQLVEVTPPSHFVAGDVEGGTWCLALYADEDHTTRLVSRWRQRWDAHGLAARFFVLISDPGAFIMEQRMLRGIKARAESRPRMGSNGHRPNVLHVASAGRG